MSPPNRKLAVSGSTQLASLMAATSPDRDFVLKTKLKCGPGLPSCCNGIGLGAVTNPGAIGDELGQEDALNPQVGEIMAIEEDWQ